MMDEKEFERMGRAKYVSLTTFRKNGEGVGTAIWIAPDPGDPDVLYAFTAESTGKVKRIRNNPQVLIAPSDMRGKVTGPPVASVARILPATEGTVADRALNRKYPVAKRLLGLLRPFGRGSVRVYLEIRPAPAEKGMQSA